MTLPEILQYIGAFGLSVGTASVIIYALSKWLGQVWAARILENERFKFDQKIELLKSDQIRLIELVKHNLGKNAFAFTKQYEKEFLVYQSLWREVVLLYSAANALRPRSEFVPAGETEEDRKKWRLKHFGDTMNKAKEVILFEKPFYSEEIYNLAQELNLLCHTEAVEYRIGKEIKDTATYWKEAEENGVKIVALSNKICDAIRRRLKAVESDIEK